MPRAFRVLAGLVLASIAGSGLLAIGPAVAGDPADRRGSCSGGPGDWRLVVAAESGGTLRVRFRIDHVRPGQSWQIFLSDDGTRFFSGTRVADDEGRVRVARSTWNRAGTDRIAASGVNAVTGTTCEGSLGY